MKQLWVETFRPKLIDDIIFQDAGTKSKFVSYVNAVEIPNLLLVGVQGSGKTTISRALITELGIDEADVLTVNCSDETSVDGMREKIKGFAYSMPMGSFKVVQLEECLEENTLIVILREGKSENIKIKNLKPETDLIKTFNIEKSRIEYCPFELLNTGNRDDMYELELEDGEIIVCTSNHKWFVENNGNIEVVTTIELMNFGHILSPDYK